MPKEEAECRLHTMGRKGRGLRTPPHLLHTYAPPHHHTTHTHEDEDEAEGEARGGSRFRSAPSIAVVIHCNRLGAVVVRCNRLRW